MLDPRARSGDEGRVTGAPPPARPRAERARLVLFAAGDFAFNLYWQSVMLFLLFYYTEALGLPVALAGLTFAAALAWDGIVSLAAGMLAERGHGRGGYARFLWIGALPLGLSFVLAYLPPPFAGEAATAAWVLGGHLIFRTAYALVNIPYLAMSARVSLDSRDRALVAGLRMLFGASALVVVATGTAPLGRWLAGSDDPARAYSSAAMLFAALGALLLVWVGRRVPELVPPARDARPTLARAFAAILRNRAYWTLNAAAFALVVASSVLHGGVLYYFKYRLGDEAAGTMALSAMGVVGAAAVPLWTVACRRIGARSLWFVAGIAAVLCLAGFLVVPIGTAPAMQAFLMGMQAAIIGLNVALWSMLPDTVEYGERASGVRAEGLMFGLATLIQRLAIGVATGLFGLALGWAGFRAGAVQSPAAMEGLRLTMALLPLGALLVSLAAMAANPLRRRTHAAIEAALER